MTRPTCEQLLGYLLGALDSKECIEVERAVAGSPEVAAEFEKLRSSLGTVGLLSEPESVDPPLCLAARTCEFVEARIESFAAETVALKAVTADAFVAADDVVVAKDKSRQPKVTLSPVTRAEVQGYSLRKLDLVVACSVVLVGAAICFPLLYTSAFQANVLSCQNHLRQLSQALQSYSDLQPDGAFPHVAASGPRSVAGIYAPTLLTNKLIEKPSTFFCPGNPQLASSMARKFRIPTLDELDVATEPQLTEFQNTMGGSYGYNLGYTRDETVLPPRNSRRANYAILADAPHDSQPGRFSTNHDRRGQNVLFEDGQIRFVNLASTRGSEAALDDPFHNRLGLVAAGLDINDAVLGRSNDHPLPIMP
jgi:hypothetical protein